MKAHYLYLVPVALLAACSTVQENPNYQFSSKYGEANTDFANAQGSALSTQYGTSPAATVQSASTVRVAQNNSAQPLRTISLDEYCMEKNRKRELIGAGLGGTVGAIAGKALGGTEGAIAGAALGGTAGYAAGDATLDCRTITHHSPAQVPASTGYTTYSAPSQPVTSYPATAPTDQAYNADQMMGTPGYQLYLQEQAAATPVGQQPVQGQTYRDYHSHAQQGTVPTHAHTQSQGHAQTVPASGPRAVNYDYSQNVVTAGGGPVNQSYHTQPSRPPAAPRSYSANAPEGYSGGATPAYQAGPQGNYLVRQGDTVYSLSRARCIPVTEFSQINGLDANYTIKIDQALILPPSRC